MDIVLLAALTVTLIIILALDNKVEKLKISLDHLLYRIEKKESGEE